MTRADLEQLDTKRLRALAKQHLAARARSLRTRGALLEALTRTLAPTGPLAPPPSPLARKRPGRRSGAMVSPSPTSGAPPRAPASSTGGTATGLQKASAPRAHLPESDVLVEEGFFLRPGAPRPEPRRPEAPAREDAVAEEAPKPPSDDEVPHLLARDATTLFLFWDFRRDLERGAAFGLHAPRVLFHLYDGEALVRTVEAPLGKRSLYLEGLTPGHLYSVEAWLAGSDGHARPTGRRSAPLRLARAVASERLDVEVVRVPLTQALSDFHPDAVPSGQRTPLSASGRLELPSSLDWRGGTGPAGPRSGRP
jgi:hypothetical protein